MALNRWLSHVALVEVVSRQNRVRVTSRQSLCFGRVVLFVRSIVLRQITIRACVDRILYDIGREWVHFLLNEAFFAR